MALCARCGRESGGDARFCAGCGAPLDARPGALREERKVVTVLFADLVGFTSASERLDPEDVRATLSPYYARLRAELERHGGTVEKFIGDAVMAVFGAPVAHEDDPERAVRAALAIRDAVGDELQLRIGVNTGEALVALDARPAEGEGMVAGDVVNTAARIQSAAPLNGILVGEGTYRSTERAVEYRDAEPVVAKGKAEPIRVWEALHARSRFGVDVGAAGRAELVGRERELEILRGALARAREERAPQLVTLVGAPGLGKSRLVHELFRAVDEDPELIWWRQGRSLPYGEGVAFWALGEMVKGQAGILETDDAAAASEKLRSAVEALVADEADAHWVAAHLRPLVGLSADARWQGDQRTEAFAAWRRFFEALAEQRPLVLVFEDLQWADDDLVDFVDHLVDWVSGVPLLVVCAARPELLERRPGWGGGKPNATTVSLTPLSDEQTALLVSALLEHTLLPEDVRRTLLERAGGNPLYAEEYARVLAERPDVDVPETLQGLIAARLDGLAVEEKALLQEAAILGKVFWLGALEAMGAGPDRGTLEARLHALERKQFVRRERRSSVGGDSEYAFLHVLIRDAAYGQIPRAERAAKHVRAAEWMESLGRVEDAAEMLAHHYRHALDLARAAGTDPGELAGRARMALRDAGDRAAALGSSGSAAAFYEQALELWPPDDPDRPDLLLSRARARFASGQSDVQLVHEATRALLAAGNAEGAAEAEAIAAGTYWNRGERDLADAHLERALELAPAHSPARAVALVERARLLMLGGESEAAIETGTVGRDLAEQLELPVHVASALITVGTARIHVGDPAGSEELARGVEIARDARSMTQLHRGLNNTSEYEFRSGRLDSTVRILEEMRAAATEYGFVVGHSWLDGQEGAVRFETGEWDAALEMSARLIAGVEAGDPHYLAFRAYLTRAMIGYARGDHAGALADAERALALVEAAKDPQARGGTLAQVARLLVAADRPGDAEPLVDEALALHDAAGGFPYFGYVSEVAWPAFDTGRRDAYGERARATRDRTVWLEIGLMIVDGDFARAADAYAEIGARTDEAHARLRAAEQRAPGGERDLQAALAFFRSVGATTYVGRGEALLAAAR